MARELLYISHRRKQRWVAVKVLSWVLLAIAAAGALAAPFYIPSLRISSISFAGLEGLDEAGLRSEVSAVLSEKYFFIFPKNNAIFLPRKEISALLAGMPRVEEFSIKIALPSKLEIKVKERKPWAIWCRQDGESVSSCALSDKNGFVFAAAPFFSGSAVLKILDQRGRTFFGETFLAKDKLDKITLFSERLKKKFGEETREVVAKKEDEVRLVLKSGWYITLDFKTDWAKAFENLALALEHLGDAKSKLEYIDLRFSDKVFYRPKQ